jgi:hypothetical protein
MAGGSAVVVSPEQFLDLAPAVVAFFADRMSQFDQPLDDG